MKKAIGLIIGLFLTLGASGQVLTMTPLGPKASDVKEIIKEFKEFIIYKGDTLNRRNTSGKQNGAWIEYRKAYLQRTNGVTTDSTNVSYVVEAKGQYIKGKKNGLWNSYYKDGSIKESIKYD